MRECGRGDSGGGVHRVPDPDRHSYPSGIAAGPDGNLWFTEGNAGKIALVGAGVSAASIAAPSVTGSVQQGTQQVCQGDRWADWAGQQPLVSAYGFDGYQWLLDGTPIAGQTARSYTPATGDIGHQLSCTVTVSYPLLGVTASASSAAVTVIPQASGPTGPLGPAGRVKLVTCRTVERHPHVTITWRAGERGGRREPNPAAAGVEGCAASTPP